MYHVISRYVSLFQEVPSASKDLFFAHFYEAFSFSVLLALQSAYPKAHDRFASADFKRKVRTRSNRIGSNRIDRSESNRIDRIDRLDRNATNHHTRDRSRAMHTHMRPRRNTLHI